MTYFIAYDIAQPKRLVKAAKILENFGLRVQYSFFECEMEPKILDTLIKSLLAVIDCTEDSLHVYPLCEDCLRKPRVLGKGSIYVPCSYQIL